MRSQRSCVLTKSVLSLFLCAPALAQLPNAAAPDFAQAPSDTISLALPENFVASSPFHRVRFAANDELLLKLLDAKAIVWQLDYSSFFFALVDARRLGGVANFGALGLELVDDASLVNLNGYLIDGADGAGTALRLASIPPFLRAPEGQLGSDEIRLRLVQFAGPIQDAWLDALRASGSTIVSYVANNSYVVRCDASAHQALENLRSRPFILSVSNYEPAFKLRPELRPPYLGDAQFYPVTVQVIADGDGAEFAAGLGLRAVEVRAAPNAVLNYINVGLVMDGANVLDLARDPHVFAIEPLDTARMFDERQGMLQAGQLNVAGTGPASATYLSWLGSKGFPGVTPFPFVVDVQDDGIDRGSTSDINVEFRVGGTAGGATRLAYNNNYSGDALADGVAGHGNINASIVGGYNDLTGSGAEDAGAYQYGLGIAPWVQLGNSKVFNNAGSGVFNQPTLTRMSNAYGGGARISSNSWGYTTGTTYNSDSQAHDTAVRDAQSGTSGNQELTIVFAAGNSGSGASTVHPPGTAKNVITVGASENDRQTGSDGCGIANTGADNANDIISFSSRGPTSDARKKPELVSVGTHVQGAASRATGYNGSGVCNQYWPSGQTLYAWSSGTSHSTPAIAGACALVRQFFVNNGSLAPTPAMEKAWLAGTSTYMTGVGANDTLWSNSQGFGRANLGAAFDGVARVNVDQTQVLGATGATFVSAGNIASGTSAFRVALAWTDSPGPTTGNAYVNDLDLELTVNGTLYRGNVFSGANSLAGGSADPRNNLECVFLPAGTSGSYSVTVRAANIAGDGVPGNADTTDQDFALVIYNGTAGAPPPPDFSVSASPSSNTVVQGAAANYTAGNTALNGFTGDVTWTATPAITGTSFGFSPNPATAGAGSTFTASTSAATPVGTYLITLTGTSGALVHSTGVTLVVNAPGGGAGSVKTYSRAPGLAIPDNNATGVTDTLNVADNLTITSLSVSTVIPHTYKGDLVVTLIGPDNTSAILHNRTGGSTDNVTTTFAVATTPNQSMSVFNGKSSSGAWKLKVQDLAAADLGTLSSWKLTFNGEKSQTVNLAIPDNNTTGVTSAINFVDSGLVAAVKVRVSITHTFKGNLEVSLIAPDGTTAILHNRTGGSTDNVNTEYPDLTASAQSLAVFTGKAISGNWSVKVRDLAAADTGTFVSWTLSFQAQ